MLSAAREQASARKQKDREKPVKVHRPLFASLFVLAHGAGDASAASPSEACARLANVPVPATAIMLPTSGARVISAVSTAATGTDTALVAEHCKVKAAIKPVDASAPDI